MNGGRSNWERVLAGNVGSGTRPLTFGAIFAVILTLLFIAQQSVPVVGVAALFICPIPILLMHLIFKETRHTIMLVVVASFMISGMTNPLWGFVFLVLFGIPGIVMAVSIERKVPPLGIAVLTGIAATLATGVMMYVNFSILKVESFDSIIEKQKKDFLYVLDTQIEKLKKDGAKPEQILRLEKMRKLFLKNFRAMFVVLPAMLLVSSIFFSGVNYVVVRLVLKRLGFHSIGPFPDFKLWYLPNYFVWVPLGSYFAASFWGAGGILGSIGFVGINLLVICVVLYLLMGVSLLHYWLEKIELSRGLKIIFYLFLVMNLYLFFPLLLVAGFFDQLINFRKIGMVHENNEQ